MIRKPERTVRQAANRAVHSLLERDYAAFGAVIEGTPRCEQWREHAAALRQIGARAVEDARDIHGEPTEQSAPEIVEWIEARIRSAAAIAHPPAGDKG